MNQIFLNKKGRPRCCTKSTTAQDMFRLMPGLIRRDKENGDCCLMQETKPE